MLLTHRHQVLYIIQYSIDGSTFSCQSSTDGLTHRPLRAKRESGVGDDMKIVITHLLINSCLFLGNCGRFLEVFWCKFSLGFCRLAVVDHEHVPARCSESGTTSIFASGLFTEDMPIGLCSPVASRGGD